MTPEIVRRRRSPARDGEFVGADGRSEETLTRYVRVAPRCPPRDGLEAGSEIDDSHEKPPFATTTSRSRASPASAPRAGPWCARETRAKPGWLVVSAPRSSSSTDSSASALDAALLRELANTWAELAHNHFGGVLRPPALELADTSARLGAWHHGTRTISLSRTLVYGQP